MPSLSFVRILCIWLIIFFFFSIIPTVTFASPTASGTYNDIQDQIDAVSPSSSVTEPHNFLVITFINISLSLVGTTFMVLVIYGGYLRFSSGGDEERVEKSTRVIQAAVIGIIIILLSYAITKFVSTSVLHSVYD